MTGEPIDDWTDLAGVTVQIRKDGRIVRVGHVETVSPSADVLWIQGQGVEPRTLFQKTEGYTVWSLPDASVPIDHIYSDQKGERILLRVPAE